MEILKQDFDVELEEDINGVDVSRYLGMIIDRAEDKSFDNTALFDRMNPQSYRN